MTAIVQRQIAGLFVAEERGSHELKGVPEPVTLFQLGCERRRTALRATRSHAAFPRPCRPWPPVEIAFAGCQDGSRMWPEDDVAVVVFRLELAFVLKPPWNLTPES